MGGKFNVARRDSDPLVDVLHMEQMIYCGCEGEVALDLRFAHKDQLVEVLQRGDVPLGHLNRHDDHVLEVLVDAPQLLLQVLALVVANNGVTRVFVRGRHCLGHLRFCVENLTKRRQIQLKIHATTFAEHVE